jgi:beta-glucosidase
VIINRWFIQAITKAIYPAEALEGLAPHLPQGWQDDMALIARPINWLEGNCYTRHIHADAPGTPWPATKDPPDPLPKTQMGWEIYPEGLSRFLTRLAHDHVSQLPLYVTENGMANADLVDDNAASDQTRPDFLFSHLAAIKAALTAGANVNGFFYWRLLDH